MSDEEHIRCSFCGKSSNLPNVRIVTTGPKDVAICNQCAEIVAETIGWRPRINEGEPYLARFNGIVHRLGNFYFDVEVPDDVYVHSDKVHHAVRYALDSLAQEWRQGPYEVEPP
jgi:hypothetical protein